MNKEREALKLALEALEKLWNIIDDIDTYGDMAKADEKLYRLLVERRQRTRFEETGISTDGYMLDGGAITAIREALAEQPAQQQEPVAWATQMGEYAHIHWGAKRPEYPMVYEFPLYTSPPHRKPLTDEQIMEMYNEPRSDAEMIEFARAIEAAHGITGEQK